MDREGAEEVIFTVQRQEVGWSLAMRMLCRYTLHHVLVSQHARKRLRRRRMGSIVSGRTCNRSLPATPWMWVAKSMACRRGSPWICTWHVLMFISERGTCACYCSVELCSIPEKPNKSWPKSDTTAQTLWHLGKSDFQLLSTAFGPVGVVCSCQLLVLSSRLNGSLARLCLCPLHAVAFHRKDTSGRLLQMLQACVKCLFILSRNHFNT